MAYKARKIMIKLSRPYIPEVAYKRVIEVLKSGDLVQGKYVEQFEKDLKDYLSIEYAVLVSSGTAALHLSLVALGIKEGDEVIIPAFTFPATANVIELVGAKPVLVDINLDDFCINVSLIEKAITTKTKAIIPVHEFGLSAEIERIVDIAKKYNLFVIEDAACALGSEYKGKKCGTFGDIGCFSLHPRKAITTGEGGIIVTNNFQVAEKLRSLRNHGIKYRTNRAEFIYAGFNYRLTEVQAVIGIEQLKIIDELIDKRIQVAKMYDDLLRDIDWIKTPKVFNDRKMIYQTYHILISEHIKRNNLIKYLRESGIETNLGAYAINCLSYYQKKYHLNNKEFPNSIKSYKTGLALPIGPHLDKNSIVKIQEIITSFNKFL